ncbi:1053_t:CDS:1, partial [Acaulospora colombiana]
MDIIFEWKLKNNSEFEYAEYFRKEDLYHSIKFSRISNSFRSEIIE